MSTHEEDPAAAAGAKLAQAVAVAAPQPRRSRNCVPPAPPNGPARTSGPPPLPAGSSAPSTARTGCGGRRYSTPSAAPSSTSLTSSPAGGQPGAGPMTRRRRQRSAPLSSA